MQQWIKEVKRLSAIAHTQPHAAYSAFIRGLSSKWTYISRTVPDIQEVLQVLQPLEDAIRCFFIPTLTGGSPKCICMYCGGAAGRGRCARALGVADSGFMCEVFLSCKHNDICIYYGP